MNLTYKIAIPASLASVAVIVWVALSAQRSLTTALSQEEFLRLTETAARQSQAHMKNDPFREPFSASSQESFKRFAEEIKTPSTARITIWSRDQAILFSDLKSIIGLRSADHQDLKRLFAEEKPFFLLKTEHTNKPVQSHIGEFLDIYVPVRLAGKVVAAVEIHSSIAALLAPVDRHVTVMFYVLIPSTLLIIGGIFAVVFHDISEQRRAKEQIQRHLQRVTALGEINRAVSSTLALEDILSVLLEKIDLFVQCPSATSISLFNHETKVLEFLACRNLDKEEWKGQDAQSTGGRSKVVFETKAPLIERNVQTDPRSWNAAFFRKHGLVSYLGMPLTVKDKVLGVLSIYSKKEHDFSDEEVDFMTAVATQAAIAIQHAQLYEEMTKLASDLSRSNKVKDEFLSVMSHELRTPLNVVLGYVGMIKDRLLGDINAEQERALEKVIARAQDQLTMISGILQAVQMEAGKVPVVIGEFSLGEFLDELRSTYETPLCKEVAILWDYSPELPLIRTDRAKLRHILQNLINNAIKFTPKGSVTISARVIGTNGRQTTNGGEPADRSKAEFRVVDTGIGIPREQLPFIFDKFHQVDSSETRPFGGVGIGLYIVKCFAELLGGRVEVESAPSNDSVFTVTIPVDAAGSMATAHTHAELVSAV